MDHAPLGDSSKRPAEQRNIEWRAASWQLLDRSILKSDVLEPAQPLFVDRIIDAGLIRLDRQHGRCLMRVLEGEPAIAAPDLEHAFSTEADEALDEPQLESVRWIGRNLLGGHGRILSQRLLPGLAVPEVAGQFGGQVERLGDW